MKNRKNIRILVPLFAIVLALSLLPSYAYASVRGITNQRLPIKCYSLAPSGRINTYKDEGLKQYWGWIDCPTDEIWIEKISAAGKTAYGSYPTPSGRISRWFELDKVLVNVNGEESSFVASSQITAYKRSTGSQTYGYISRGDTVYILGEANGRTQVLYHIDGTVYDKLAFIPSSAVPYISMKATTKPQKAAVTLGESIKWDTVITGGKKPFKLNYELRTTAGKVVTTGSNNWCNDTGFGFTVNNSNLAGTFYLYVKVTDSTNRTATCKSTNVTWSKYTSMKATTKPQKTAATLGESIKWDTVITGGKMPFKLNYELRTTAGKVVATGSNNWCSDTGFGFTITNSNLAGTFYLYVKVTDSTGKTTSCKSSNVTWKVQQNNLDALAKKYVQMAISQIGRQEYNGKTKYGEKYGNPAGDWCGYFTMWCAEQVGIYGSTIKAMAYIPNVSSVYGSRFVRRNSGYKPCQGDLIIFDVNTNGTPDHVGIVDYHDGRNVYYIDGNTGSPTYYVEYHSKSLTNGTIYGYVKFRG